MLHSKDDDVNVFYVDTIYGIFSHADNDLYLIQTIFWSFYQHT